MLAGLRKPVCISPSIKPQRPRPATVRLRPMSGDRVAVADGAVPASGASLAYRRYGAGLGETVVLLHGARMDGRVWAHVAPEVARTHDVIVPDLRGRGRSACDPAVPASFARDTLLLLDALDAGRIHLVGHSMGGGVALELAWRLSGGHGRGRLATLTLVAPTPTAGWQAGPGISSFSEQLARQTAAGDRAAAFETVLCYLWLADGRRRASLDEQAVQQARAVFFDNLDPPWPPPLEEANSAQINDLYDYACIGHRRSSSQATTTTPR